MKIRRFPRHDSNEDIAQQIVESLSKKYRKAKQDEDELSISTFDESIFSEERPYAPAGIFPIDQAVSGGRGFPSGIIEIFGPESSGKTAILERVIAFCQVNNWHTLLYPAEFSPDKRRMQAVGINLKSLIVCPAETIEGFFAWLKDTVKTIRSTDKTTPILCGWDSIASTATLGEQENKKGLGGRSMGDLAGRMSDFFKRLRGFLYKNKVCLIAINQTRSALGQMYGNPETTPGGRALRFYAWVRIRVSRIKLIEKGEVEVGQISQMKVVKNKFYPPFKVCKFHLYWIGDRVGIDPAMTMWEYCVDHEVITKKGTAYRFRDNVITSKSWPKYYAKYRSRIDKMARAA